MYFLSLVIWQEAFIKAAGKKSKTSVELDLGDMLAALEKQQQAMKARQLTNTKPLSFTGIGKVNHMLKSGLKPTIQIGNKDLSQIYQK